MREIFFKAKRIDNGEWVEGAYCPSSLDSLLGEMKPKPNIIKLGGEYDGFWFEVIPETVSQYTGLQDKNGKKIFEGDKCKDLMDYIYTIQFDEGCFYALQDNVLIQLSEISSELEVIGNIHDRSGNSEIL